MLTAILRPAILATTVITELYAHTVTVFILNYILHGYSLAIKIHPKNRFKIGI